MALSVVPSMVQFMQPQSMRKWPQGATPALGKRPGELRSKQPCKDKEGSILEGPHPESKGWSWRALGNRCGTVHDWPVFISLQGQTDTSMGVHWPPLAHGTSGSQDTDCGVAALCLPQAQEALGAVLPGELESSRDRADIFLQHHSAFMMGLGDSMRG